MNEREVVLLRESVSEKSCVLVLYNVCVGVRHELAATTPLFTTVSSQVVYHRNLIVTPDKIVKLRTNL